jgi:hypothetical protein
MFNTRWGTQKHAAVIRVRADPTLPLQPTSGPNAQTAATDLLGEIDEMARPT